ncbi:PEAPOD 2 [Hibiscus trionum]|uniref:Protein TIFY n=1 Tax=Hibiscus trionum TaxID=183268 RepID=A0A9W7IRV9_HIBTR|nr:PEAPOD 2 [Hibiscus trionum]
MSTGETVCRSPLYKPISQLTEDDISQVTREDCRRYLKEKGMRRPSWNKSQAIQQVISLKTLLETTSDSDAVEASKKFCNPGPENPPRFVSDSTVLPNETTEHNGISGPVSESVPRIRPDPPKFKFSGENSVRTAVSGNASVSPRTASVAKEPAGQMTIFYCGKVNVYDNIPGCKAEAILQFAASPVLFPRETLVDQRTAPLSIPCHLQAAVKVAENCQFPQEDRNAYCEDSLGSINRNALVQRYLEKKKDRFKNKSKLETSSSRSLDVYSNQMGDQFSNEQLKQSESYSPTRAPHVSLVQLHGKSSQDCQSHYSS